MSKDSKFDHIDIAEKQKVQFFFFKYSRVSFTSS